MNYNKTILGGNLTRDPEVRFTPQGTHVATFSIAFNRKYKQAGEAKEEVSFFDIVCFGKLAEICGQYLAKGRPVLVEGRLSQRRWEDKDSGGKKSKVEIIANEIHFLGNGNAKNNGNTAPVPDAAETVSEEEEVPF